MKKIFLPVLISSLLVACNIQFTAFIGESAEQDEPGRLDIAFYEKYKSADLDTLEGDWVLIYKGLVGTVISDVDKEAGIQSKVSVKGDALSLFRLSDSENDGDLSIQIPNLDSSSLDDLSVTLVESEGVYTSEDGSLNLTLLDNGRLSGLLSVDLRNNAPGSGSWTSQTRAAQVEMVKVKDSILLAGTLNISSDESAPIDKSVDLLIQRKHSITLSKVTNGVNETFYYEPEGRAVVVSDDALSYYASFDDLEYATIEISSGDNKQIFSIGYALNYLSESLTLQDNTETVVANSASYSDDSINVSYSGIHKGVDPKTDENFTITLDARW